MKIFYKNEKRTREVLEIKRKGDDSVSLYFNYLYKDESQCVDSKTYSAKSRKLIDRKITEWIKG